MTYLTLIRKQNRSWLLGPILALVAYCCTGPAYGLGLGRLQVQSALDEPLVAEIELTAVAPGDLESLEVSLGSNEDFGRASVDRFDYLQELSFSVSKDGPPRIRVSTKQPAKEPFLHFLVSASWAGGKLVREYTALLDPPLYAAERPATVSSPRVVEAAPAPVVQTTESAPAPAPAPAAGAATPEMVPSDGSNPGSAEYGPTERGDTLWGIASSLDVSKSNINIFQVMLALLRENPDAFVDNNVNRLKVGRILRLNDLNAIDGISVVEASVAYQAQLEQWQAYKIQLADSSEVVKIASGGDAAAGAEAQAATETVATAPGSAADRVAQGDAPAGGQTSDQDLLRIVRATLESGDESASTPGTSADAVRTEQEMEALRDQITTLEESIVSRELANRELQERVRLLEGQVQNARRLVELESEELALAQQQAEERAQEEQAQEERAQEEQAREQAQATSPGTGTQPAVEAEPEVTSPAALPQPVDSQPATTQPTEPSAPVSPDSGAVTKAKLAEAETGAAQPVMVSQTESEPWWRQLLDMAIGNSMVLIAAGLGALVLLSGMLVFIRRRRSIAEFEESILSGSALDGHTETTETAASSAGTDTSFLSDFGMAGMGSMQADEVDPLAEAEVYLAYGRDEQAEEVLKEAMNRNPDRHELRLKLLEIYQQRNDLKSFETIAEELYPAGGQGNTEVWRKVVDMGRKMNPNNPLFSQEMPVVDGGGDQESMLPPDGGDVLDASIVGSTGPVDPGLQPFPPPESNVELERELEQIAGDDAPAAANFTVPPPVQIDTPEVVAGGDDQIVDFGGDELAGLDFDLDLEAPAANTQGEPDFNLDLESTEAPPAPTEIDLAPQAEIPESPETTFDLEDATAETQVTLDPDVLEFEDIPTADGNGEDPAGAPEQWDEAATKLDLARAYMNMGDNAGARSIIDEVIKEGNPAQRDQAAELAAQLS